MKVQDTESSVVAERESRFALPTEIVDLMQRQPLNNLGGRAVVPEGDVDNEDDDE